MINDIASSLRVPAQIPLDTKLYCPNKVVLANLGTNNNLAYTYYNGMIVYTVADKGKWLWREDTNPLDIGLMPVNFTYPAGLIVNGVNYGNKQYNFFPSLLSTEEIQQIEDIIQQYLIDNPPGGGGLQTTIQVGQNLSIPNLVKIESLAPNTASGLIFYTNDNGALLALLSAESPTAINNTQPVAEIGVGNALSQTKDTLAFYNNRIVLTDTKGLKGIVYGGDYEANFTARSLITKQYVDTKLPYRVYVARINQSGTSAPIVSSVYENTIGGVITYTRGGIGFYNINFTTSLTANKVTVSVTNGDAINGLVCAQEAQDTANIQMTSVLGTVSTDGVIFNALIEVRIYN